MNHLLQRLLRPVVAVLFWAGVLVLGAFGIYFSFANYPSFGIAVVLSILLVLGYSERERRKRQRASERARRRHRAQSHDL
jgi:uncharacterized membrane protein YbhN (UPF0104 family)